MKKKCTKCGKTRLIKFFKKKKGTKDGLHTWCVGCVSDYQLMYRIANRGRLLEGSKEYYRKHKDKLNQRSREYNEKNRDRIAKVKKEYVKNHLDDVRQYQKQYREKHQEKHRTFCKQYYQEHKSALSEYHKEYRLVNTEKIKKWKAEYNKTYLTKRKIIFKERYKKEGEKWRVYLRRKTAELHPT
jgi:hypothetical protein